MSAPITVHEADDDLAAALTLLARPGTLIARLANCGGSNAAVGLLRRRADGVETVGTIGSSTATLLRDRYWIEPHPQGGWRISTSGIQALRRYRSACPPSGTASLTPGIIVASAAPADLGLPSINHGESPLAWLRHRKGKGGSPLISEAQFLAGERLRADFWRAQMTPRITASWSDTPTSRRQRRSAPGTGVEMADSVMAAKDRVSRALVAVGPELAGILVDVCCHLKGLEEAEQIENLPQRSGKVVLLTALSSLARHYGLVRPGAVEAQIAGRIRAWMADGTSPNLESWRDEA